LPSRSLPKPSPFTSPPVPGVNGVPERSCPNQPMRMRSKAFQFRLYVNWWRESNEARDQSTANGSPTVLWKPRNCSRMVPYV